ncbi:MAG TPA: GNAT family N-acetyltransferase [Actinomycetota bacterium]|nr:GNAT family N-acetyltransferase [Actinomycetota bacterium]
MSIGLPRGLTSRPPTTEDIPAIVELIAAGEAHDDGVAEIDTEDLVMGFGRVGFEPSTDAVLAFDGDRLVGWAEVYRDRAEAEVRPSHRGRGLGTALLAWTEARARALGATELAQTRTDGDGAARELFVSRGYRPKWDSWILRIELDAPLPPPAIPQGIVVRPYDPARDEAAAHRVWEDAISVVRGRTPEPLDVWASQTIAHATFAPGLSRVALDGEQVVATLLAYDFAEAGEVWIGQVATAAPYRRRGIAGALLETVFAASRELGRARCGLSTDSISGARSLYERVGMRVVQSYTAYAKPLR